jgi:hypothetical protein
MEEKGIARRQPRRYRRLYEFGIIQQIAAEEFRAVEAIGVEVLAMRAGHQPERTVVLRFFAERQPHGHQVLALERPVANIAMPSRKAAV